MFFIIYTPIKKKERNTTICFTSVKPKKSLIFAKYHVFSIASGFVATLINGIIEDTPSNSTKAPTKIIINNIINLIFCGLSKI